MTHEEALAIYQAGPEVVVKTLCTLDAELTALREERAKNSRNSSQPPSSDGLKKPIPRGVEKHLRDRKRDPGKKRKPGGQKGHRGSGLKPVEDPNHTTIHEVPKCKECGCSLKNQAAMDYEARQVFDIPPMPVEVTEHRAEMKECPQCGTINKADFPDDVTAPTQYGSRIKAIAIYMKHYQLQPYKRTGEFFHDLFSLDLSEGTLVNITQDCSERLAPTIEEMRRALKDAPIAGFDETSCRVEGRRIWLHVACTSEFTYYEIHDKRGREAMDEIGILPDFKGRAIHDFWHSYLGYDCSHGLCNAHLLRELIFLYEVQEQRWAEQMIDCLLDMKDAVDKAKKENVTNWDEQVSELEARYERILDQGFVENPMPNEASNGKNRKRKKGKRKRSKAQNLLIRFRDYRKDILAFLFDFHVPFDNNLSERDLRMMKTQQKISGTFRSPDGGKHFSRIRSYISTVRKQGKSVIDSIHSVFAGQPLILSEPNP